MTQFLFVTDLDNTLVGNDHALARLNQHLSQHREEYGSCIVYATGRSPTLYRQLTTERLLLEPDILVPSVGTAIYFKGTETPDPEWISKLSQNWNREQVVAIAAHFADLQTQPPDEQTPFKASYFLAETVAAAVLPKLESALKQQGLDIQLVYSSGRDLDILPRQGNKGSATRFLQQRLNIPPERTVMCGDSGNDLSFFQQNQEARGIIVGNAQPELLEWHQANPSPNRYLAHSHCAAGILEGLLHFGFLSQPNPAAK